MRRVLALVGLAFLLLWIPAAGRQTVALPNESAPDAITAAQQDPESQTVYVTRTGSKYHRDGCRHLRRSKIPMSLKEAAKRYGPCSVCRPPTLRG